MSQIFPVLPPSVIDHESAFYFELRFITCVHQRISVCVCVCECVCSHTAWERDTRR